MAEFISNSAVPSPLRRGPMLMGKPLTDVRSSKMAEFGIKSARMNGHPAEAQPNANNHLEQFGPTKI